MSDPKVLDPWEVLGLDTIRKNIGLQLAVNCFLAKDALMMQFKPLSGEIFMKKSHLFVFITFFVCMFSVAFAQEPMNIAFLKQDLVRYHDSGEYEYAIDKVTAKVEDYILQRVSAKDAAKQKMALVFDIDETVLSGYKYWVALGFGGTIDEINADICKGDEEAIPGALHLYNFAKAHNVKVIFITSREEGWKKLTEDNLTKVGFKNWDGLILRPVSDKKVNKSATPFKTKMRKQLVDQGYDIIASVGDQYSDLVGGYADRNYKLPNPFYYLP